MAPSLLHTLPFAKDVHLVLSASSPVTKSMPLGAADPVLLLRIFLSHYFIFSLLTKYVLLPLLDCEAHSCYWGYTSPGTAHPLLLLGIRLFHYFKSCSVAKNLLLLLLRTFPHYYRSTSHFTAHLLLLLHIANTGFMYTHNAAKKINVSCLLIFFLSCNRLKVSDFTPKMTRRQSNQSKLIALVKSLQRHWVRYRTDECTLITWQNKLKLCRQEVNGHFQ